MTELAKPATRGPLQAALLLLAVLGALALGVLFNLYLSDGTLQQTAPVTKSATLLTPPKSLQPFALTDHHGNPFTQDSLRDRWTLLSFGYTHCPDICPTTLSMLSQVDDRLKQQGVPERYQMVFVSIDPERDDIERLSEYVPYFNAGFIGATGETQALQRLTRQLGILYARVDSEQSAMSYLMDHSASIVVTDPEGRFRALFSAPHDATSLAEDMAILIDRE